MYRLHVRRHPDLNVGLYLHLLIELFHNVVNQLVKVVGGGGLRRGWDRHFILRLGSGLRTRKLISDCAP